MRERVFLIATCVVIASAALHSQCLPQHSDIPQQFVIENGHIKLPVGAFLLVRKSGAVGAIRLVKIDPVGPEWLGKSTYEAYFGALKSTSVRQTGEIDLHASPPQDNARVGQWLFPFVSPNVMTMAAVAKRRGGYEFAPTSACTLKDVDVHDKRLQWFRFDGVLSATLSVAELAK